MFPALFRNTKRRKFWASQCETHSAQRQWQRRLFIRTAITTAQNPSLLLRVRQASAGTPDALTEFDQTAGTGAKMKMTERLGDRAGMLNGGAGERITGECNHALRRQRKIIYHHRDYRNGRRGGGFGESRGSSTKILARL
jgi:hypothetical protein